MFRVYFGKNLQFITLCFLCHLFVWVEFSQPITQPNYTTQVQPNNNYMKSSVFRQEIARFQITVTREGKAPLPITQVPRVQQGDVLKVKLLDEQVGGLKLDQSQWDWTFLVTFVNPSRRMNVKTEKNNLTQGDKPIDNGSTISEEINFRKSGWYKEYAFTVPYDSQPVFFLYPRPKYRKQLLKVVSGKYEELRKLGEKTIELAGAYSQINSFLNELQFILNRNAQLYGFSYLNKNNSTSGSSTYNPYSSTYNPYGTSTYNPSGSTYNPYSPYNTNNNNNKPNQTDVPIFGLQMIPMLNQIVEGLARSFNISLPSCWGNGSSYGGSYGSYNPYGSTGSYGSTYGGSYGSTYGSTYGGYSSYGSNYGNTPMMDFVNRAQCVAKNVNLQDFDISVTKMWQQGGVFLAAELQRKYPQIAYWINIAATAIDFIVKVFQKAPLRIVPTVVQSNDGSLSGRVGSSGVGSYGNNYSANYSNNSGGYSPNSSTPNSSANNSNAGKISLFADTQPAEGQFVTAFPIVVHKWQANPDPEVISLYPPILSEPCLHAGLNVLKSIELSNQTQEDPYSRDFRLVVSSSNGFKKEFPLKKNLGLGGWELNLTQEDLNQIPKIQMSLEAEVVGTRGFNEIRSPKFDLPMGTASNWEITQESQKNFTVGGKRTITIRNTIGNCRCLQAVIYKPSFGGQFVFTAGNPNSPNSLQISSDGKEVSFEVDATNFQPGQGTIEIKTLDGDSANNQTNNQYGGNQYGQNKQAQGQSFPGQFNIQSGNNLQIKLYPAFPSITDVKARRGDKEILLTGERLEQVNSITINGKKAVVKGKQGENQSSPSLPSSASYPNQAMNNPNPAGYPNQQNFGNQPNLPNSQNSVNSQNLQNSPNLYQNLGANQKVFVFEDGNNRINSEYINLELMLEDNRSVNLPNRIVVGSSRPSIKANERNEVQGSFIKVEENQNDNVIIQNQTIIVNGKQQPREKTKAQTYGAQFDLRNYPVVLNDKNKLTIAVQNILTDYNFKTENLSVETNIENATLSIYDLPNTSFEVLDTDNLRINFNLNPSTIKSLSGRRLQFRIKDRERGDSDWYTIKQTFVRIPQIELVKCGSNSSQSLQSSQSYGVSGTNQTNSSTPNSATLNSGNSVNSISCELRGEGLDYISQISVDGGRSWTNSGQVEPTAEGNLMMKIPFLINQKFLQIKLRDYPNTEGLTVTNFTYSNSLKKTGKQTKPVNNQKEIEVINSPISNLNQPISQEVNHSNRQPTDLVKTNNTKIVKPKTKKKNIKGKALSFRSF